MNVLPVLSYVLISTFTPGPSNITTTSLAVLHGYKATLRYQAGLAVVVFVFMVLAGWLSTWLLAILPALEPLLRYAGAAYILYLAWSILKATYAFAEQEVEPLGFVHGVMLQSLNPKLFVYAFTLFAGFLAPIANQPSQVVLAAALLAATAFIATSVWALFGSAIKRFLHIAWLRTTVNILLALALVYTALELIELNN
ncbi:MAG: LysE family transporter [Caldilineaceae bacterium]